MKTDYIKGRGSQLLTNNKFNATSMVFEHAEGLDEMMEINKQTQVFYDDARKIVNEVKSPDVGMSYSVNPYQGCEHGCIYCYARNAHEYWGFNAGIDFESKIVVKRNAVELLKQKFNSKSWKGDVISVSGNTDCYQPLERKYQLTRGILETCLAYKNPVGIITKNQLILRDLDLLCELNQYQLLQVFITITSLDENIRLKLEPRTSTYQSRLKTIEKLSCKGIPCGVMIAPIIPGLTNYGIASVMKAASDAGATQAGYTIVRLNGAIGPLFTDWVHKAYPDAAHKILSQIADCHGGSLNDNRFGTRMKGEGKIAESIRMLFLAARQKYMSGNTLFQFNTHSFARPGNLQTTLF